jgi:hypothetical protein
MYNRDTQTKTLKPKRLNLCETICSPLLFDATNPVINSKITKTTNADIVKDLSPKNVSSKAEILANGMVIINSLLCIIELVKSVTQLKPKLFTKWLKNLLIIFKTFL